MYSRAIASHHEIIFPEYPERQSMSDEQADQPAHHLRSQEPHGQPVFPHRAPPHQPEVQDCEVAALDHLPLRVRLDT